jgi:predicted CoA-binding protein
MQAQGFEIVGVNPSVSETILGCPVYARLADVPGPLEVINVFRNSSVVASLIDELLPLRPKVIWLQEGVFDPSAENRARAAGIQVVSDTCIWKIWASRPRQ